MSTANILKAIRTQDWHSANEAFSQTMQQKLADRLVAERKTIFKEGKDDTDGTLDYNEKAAREEDDAEFAKKKKKDPKAIKGRTVYKEGTLLEGGFPKSEVQRVFSEIGDVSEVEILMNLKDLKVADNQVVSFTNLYTGE